MKLTPTIILCGVAVALFFLGRFTAPKPVENNNREIDSLRRGIAFRDIAIEKARDSVKQFSILADTWFKMSEETRKEKVITRTIYRNDTSKINDYSVPELDSVFRARYCSPE